MTSVPTPPQHPTIPVIVLAVCGVLLGAGIKMYSSPTLGLILIVVSVIGLWWVLLPALVPHFSFSQTKAFWLGCGIIIAIGLVVWWWTPTNNLTDASPSVFSKNQSGGITANNVFINPHPPPQKIWGLNDKQLALLTQRMSPYAQSDEKGDFITCLMNNPDSTKFATSLAAAFRSAGWTIPGRDGFASALFHGAPVGIIVTIHSKDARPSGLKEFLATLKEADIDYKWQADQSLPPDRFKIIVGHRPSR